ncbi:MAG: YHS domain-containing protein [Acidobacteria bacterium]|nr:YHS domain-containing protein [Acidobacteriota bacterium]
MLHLVATHIDPVCGMTVDPAKNKGGSFEFEGTTYYFCGQGCRLKFEADPTGWLKSGPKGMGKPTAGQAVPVTLTLKRPASATQDSGTSRPLDSRTPGPGFPSLDLPHGPGNPGVEAGRLSEVRHGA